VATIYDVPASMLIERLAEKLKAQGDLKPPEWAKYVKTGGDKEKQPENEDWWYVRCASLLRKVHLKGPIGLPTLRRLYGGKKNRGHNPEQMRGASGSLLRDMLKQLERAELVKKTKEGRVTTPKAASMLDSLSNEIKREIPELSKY
jgi:small subunit ribosomal protein S19e